MSDDGLESPVGRTDALEAAAATVGGRDGSHGEPEDNFGRIATFWSTYLDLDIESHDVAAMMALLKVARIASGDPTNYDHWVDIDGYGALGAHLADRERKQDGEGQ